MYLSWWLAIILLVLAFSNDKEKRKYSDELNRIFNGLFPVTAKIVKFVLYVFLVCLYVYFMINNIVETIIVSILIFYFIFINNLRKLAFARKHKRLFFIAKKIKKNGLLIFVFVPFVILVIFYLLLMLKLLFIK